MGAEQEAATESVWTLPSGMMVAHRQSGSAPVVAIQVWVGVGAADETGEELGLAHVHEHMVFKGTARRAVGEIAAQIEEVGGSINAWTSFDETVYHTVMPAEHVERGLDILLDATLHAAFDADELERELEVIREELRRGEDQPRRVHMQHLLKTVFDVHPYGRPIIGTEESLDTFDRERVLSFFQRWYRPENLRLVVVGDVSRQRLEAILDNLLSSESTRSSSFTGRPRRSPQPAQTRCRFAFDAREVENAQLTVGFPAPPREHPDTAGLHVLAMLAGGMNRSPLYDRLVRQEQVALTGSASFMSFEDAGVFAANAAFSPDEDPLEVIALLAEELSMLANERFSDADVHRALRHVEAGMLRETETVQGVATRIGHYLLHTGDPDYGLKMLESARKLRASDLRAIAARWLRPELATIALLVPASQEIDAPREEACVDALENAWGADAAPASSSGHRDQDGYERVVLDNGVTLIMQQDSAAPIFSLAVHGLPGSLLESDELLGSTSMMASLLKSGSRTFDTRALEREIDALGCSLDSSSASNTTHMSLLALSHEQSASLRLLASCLFDSNFPEEELERVRRVRLRYLAQQAEIPSVMAMRRFAEAMYGTHPYARPQHGTEASMKAVEREDILALHRRFAQPANMVVSAVGDFDIDGLVHELSCWRSAEGATALSTDEGPVTATPSRGRFEVMHRRKQAFVLVGYEGLTREDPGLPALQLLNAILAGQGGRLFKSLREERSLAYSVSATHSAMRYGGDFMGWIETGAEKIDAAVDGLRECFADLARDGVSTSEWERARARMVGQRQVGFQRQLARCYAACNGERLGYGYRYYLDFADRLQRVTLDDMHAVIERVVRPGEETIVVARPEDV